MDRFKILLSGLFLIYLILDGFKNYLSFYLAIVFVIGLFLDWYWGRQKKLQYDNPVRLSSIPPQENSIFQLLGNLMRSNGLEMRLRRAEFLWNVTLLKNGSDGVTRMVARGSAPSITEAIMRAEGDFEKRNKPEAS